MSAYVVRDRTDLSRSVLGGVVSAAVVVAICAWSGRWWILVIGLPLALGAFARQVARESIALRADERGLTLGSGQVPWSDIDEVSVGSSHVQVTLGSQALPAPGTRGVVTDPDDPTSRQVWTDRVGGDGDAHVSGIRGVAPSRVVVRLED